MLKDGGRSRSRQGVEDLLHVVVPAGYYHRGYYGPRVAVVAPAPVVVVRPYR